MPVATVRGPTGGGGAEGALSGLEDVLIDVLGVPTGVANVCMGVYFFFSASNPRAIIIWGLLELWRPNSFALGTQCAGALRARCHLRGGDTRYGRKYVTTYKAIRSLCKRPQTTEAPWQP